MGLKKSTKVMPHQQAAIDKAMENDGSILLSHKMGLGKTLSSIAIADKLMSQGKAKHVLAVVPAALRSNFADNGVNKYTNDKITLFGTRTETHTHIDDDIIPNTPYYAVSYEMFKQNPHRYIDKTKADTLIVDEMHNFRNPSTVNYQQMRSARKRVRNFIGLTGTPFSNSPYDVVPLIDIVSNGQHKLGKSPKEFSDKFIQKTDRFDMYGKKMNEKTETIKNKDVLASELDKWVHHATTDSLSKDSVPKKMVQDINVEMSTKQQVQYDFVMRRVPAAVRNNIRNGLPVSRREAFHVLPMLQQARNVMNGEHYLDKNVTLEQSAYSTPKIKKALDDVEAHLNSTADGQVIIHSHLLEGGCDVVSAGLRVRGIKHGIFTGKEKHSDRERAVKDYNAGKTKVIVVSSAATNGLNLPNTTLHIALDSHYNPSVNQQIEARGVRAGGQSSRAPEHRKVMVRRYRSVYPDTWMNKMGIKRKSMSVDEWIGNLAKNKQDVNNQVDALLKTASVSILDMYNNYLDSQV